MEADGKPRALIVDDASENIQLLMETLQDECILLAAKNGEKALRLARSEPRPDVILLDIMMPGMDGYEVCRRLKADHRTGSIPVIFVTAKDAVVDEEKGFELGAVDYIGKPFHPAIVRTRVRSQIERRRAEARIRRLERTESLTRMAAAIAHCCNNLLAIVIGNLELAMEDLRHLPPLSSLEASAALSSSHAENLSDAMEAAHRASEIGRLMLAYLGQTTARREPLELGDLCRRHLPHLRADLPPRVALRACLDVPDMRVKAVAEQIREVLDKLTANAREALEDRSGSVTLTAGIVEGSSIPAGPYRFPADFRAGEGDYACLEVADDGQGIPPGDMDKIFDPFFSTRFIGRGLGLPVVLGIAKACDGCVVVESAPARGAVFRVYLPLSA